MKKVICFISIAFATSMAFGHEGHLHKEDQIMDKVLEQYLKIQESLASDSQATTKEAAQEVMKLSLQLRGEEKKKAKEIMSGSQKISSAKSIDEAREGFKALSAPVVEWAKRVKLPEIDVLSCSMAKASWVQKKGDVKNPYMGSKMLSCGDKAS